MSLQTGQILENRYRIETLLGQGGMGAVYRAIDLKFNTPVALKENRTGTVDSQRQFAREAGLLHQLRHPNLPRVTDHFAIAGEGQYLVMDYIEGDDLKCLVARLGPIPEAQALSLIDQVLDALEYLHSRQVIHRDVKPSNVKITPQGHVFLVDFGLAKVYDPGEETTVGARGATPGYAPPEQYGQGRTDARSDVYSAGAMLYTLLTGKVPPDALEMVIRRGNLPSLQDLVPGLSPHVEAAVGCAMQTVPDDRFQTARAFREALREPPTEVLPRKAPAPAAKMPTPAPAPAPPPALEADTHQRIAALLIKAREALDQEALDVAEAWCRDALDLDSQHVGTRQLLQEVREAQQLGRQYARAQEAMQTGDWAAAASSLEEVTVLAPNYRNAQRLLQQARAERERDAARPAPPPAAPEPSKPQSGQGAGRATPGLRERLSAPSPRFLVISIVAVVVLLIIVPTVLLLTGDGGGTTPDVQAPATSGGQSPVASDGGILFTSTRDGKREIYWLHEGQTLRLTETPGRSESWDPAWSKSGILFTSNRDGGREIYRLHDGQTDRVTHTTGGESWGAVWSDNGLYFTSTRAGRREIYRLHEGQTERVTNTSNGESWGAVLTDSGLYFTSTRDGKREIYRLHEGQSVRVTNTSGGGESWGAIPTNSGLLLTSTRDGKREIYRLHEGETERVTHTSGGAESWAPAWTEGIIRFTSNRDGKREIYRLYEGQTERVTNTGGRGESWLFEREE